jgi:hypothetical protein
LCHSAASPFLCNQLTAQAPAGTYFVLNRTFRTALGKMVVPNLHTDAAKKRPDIIIVQPLGAGKWKVHAIEVLSGNQTRDEMLLKLDTAWRNKVEPCNGDVVKGTFDAGSITWFPPINW